jgi:hypothetical protein
VRAEVLARFLLWRLLAVVAFLATLAASRQLLDGSLGAALRGSTSRGSSMTDGATGAMGKAELSGSSMLRHTAQSGAHVGLGAVPLVGAALVLGVVLLVLVVLARWRSRARRRYVRLRVDPYGTDHARADAVVAMFEALHKRLLRRWWRRLWSGQPSVGLEVHHNRQVWLAVTCPVALREMVQAALRTAYPNCKLDEVPYAPGTAPQVLRLKKHASFIKRAKVLERFAHERELPMNRLMTVMAASGGPAFVQLALTPAPTSFERYAKLLFKRHEAHLSRERREHLFVRDRSIVELAELQGAIDVQHRPLFFVELRVVAANRVTCERIASELRAEEAENRLVERGTSLRHGVFGLYGRRVQRGEGNPLPSMRRSVFASTELAALWHMPSVEYSTVPFRRGAVPLATAAPSIMRPRDGLGTLRDALGPVSIHPDMRKQNTAVPGTVEQGKSSYLVATVAEDLGRDRCAVIVLDPKGDAADAALSLVSEERICTLLDFSHPTCGFNPLAIDAPADVIADYVVNALKNLFTDADIRASSDRYLRNAVIAVLAYERSSTLWDAARLLSVGEEGYAYRARVGAHVRALPEFKEISEFFTAELSAQLADARSTTTAKLDAPVNKLARLLNSPSIKRILLNDSLTVDFEQVIAQAQVLVVKGAMGAMGAGNTSVLMQLLVGMLDAALARQQDLVAPQDRIAVALKVDEAPLVLNRGFAETMALKRSAGLETVACWQTDAQWLDRDVREQLDALFAHRVYFATASAKDARAAASLIMASYSDVVRPDVGQLSTLGHPDARLRLPKHHAIVSWTTPEGRQPPFLAQTIQMRVDDERLAAHAARQRQRGARHRTDLSQRHWDRAGRPATPLAGQRRRRGETARSAQPSTPLAPQAASPEPARVAPARAAPARAAPARTPDSFAELVELDKATSVRWAKQPAEARRLEADELDLEILDLIASIGYLLSSQIHRRFNPARASTTTQRRLKRLSEAGLVERFQFYRSDGGGVPMCYVISPAGLQNLVGEGRLSPELGGQLTRATASAASQEQRLRRARRVVHAAGWALGLEQALGLGQLEIRGGALAAISPPLRSGAGRHAACGPSELRLPGGRTPHDFLRTVAGRRIELESFETVRPEAIVEIPTTGTDRVGQPGALDVFVELDDRLSRERNEGAQAKLERYDHFVAGWSTLTKRYAGRTPATALVVFICRDKHRARACAQAADSLLTACRAYAGEYPADWEYPGRERIVFAAERDMHEGLLSAYGVHPLPPEVRASLTAEPQARATTIEHRDIVAGVAPLAHSPGPRRS